MNTRSQRSEIRGQICRKICPAVRWPICGNFSPAVPPSAPPAPRPQAANAICAANCGFTIIEILGVLTILAILIAMLVSVVGTVQRKTQQYRAEADANALVQSVLHYRQVYGAWPCEQSRTNEDFFAAGVGDSNLMFFSSDTFLGHDLSPDVDQAAVIAALSPDNPANPRRIQFLTIANNALRQGRLADPWGHPYLLLMDMDTAYFAFGDFSISNLSAVAISAGAPNANPGPANWIFSAGVKP